MTYDSTATNGSVEVTVFSIHTQAEASAFTAAAMTEWGTLGPRPARKRFPAIRGSVVEVGTKAGHDGFYVVDAFAIKEATR